MRAGALVAALMSVALAGCTTGDSLGGTRTVFDNPYSALEFDNGPVGPGCNKDVAVGEACYIDSLIYPGRGRYAFDREGNRVRLSKEQRRVLQERFDLVQSRIEQLEAIEQRTRLPEPPPVKPPPTALPPPAPETSTGGVPQIP
ncbi:MAG: hypothetical protein QNJ15_05395 [Erythrobacter sp.]|nr:hypothetical protein [Erythrobacter sp.]